MHRVHCRSAGGGAVRPPVSPGLGPSWWLRVIWWLLPPRPMAPLSSSGAGSAQLCWRELAGRSACGSQLTGWCSLSAGTRSEPTGRGTRAYLWAGLPGAEWGGWPGGRQCRERRRRPLRGRAALHRPRPMGQPDLGRASSSRSWILSSGRVALIGIMPVILVKLIMTCSGTGRALSGASGKPSAATVSRRPDRRFPAARAVSLARPPTS